MAIDLQVELTDLRRAILTMAATVEQRISRVITALLNQDLELAKKVRHGDREIDEMEIDIEAECLRILALSHPVAGDLRFVLSVMRINTDLERAADVAKGIAKRVIHLDRSTTVQSPQALAEMGAAAQEMFSNAVGALANEDTDLCRRIRRSDDRVDDLQREVIVWAQSEVPHHVDWLDAAIDILSIAKNLERIGDLATNIAEDVVFLIEGAVIRHTKV